MNTENEQLSAWLDDEDVAPVLRQAAASEEACASASRYQLMGEALRGGVSDASLIDVRAQVRAAIENEVMDAAAPRRARPSSAPGFSFADWLADGFANLWKPVGGLAVAASVAAVVVVTLNQQPLEQGVQQAPVAAVATTHQPVRPAAMAIPASNPAVQRANVDLARPALNSSSELNRYVSKHSEFAAQDTVQGMMPYARAVSISSQHNGAPANPR